MSAPSLTHEPQALERAPLAMLLALFAALSLPFLGKAFHIDDTLFVFAARQIRHHPADFYGFNVNWYGTVEPMYGVTRNPPLVCYYLALADALFGESELAFHLALLLPALGAVAGTYFLARRFCDSAVLATALAIFSPAFFVSSTTVMSDVPVVCLWLLALLAWLRGLERARLGWLLLSGVLLGVGGLTKYYGLALIPLLVLYTLWKERRAGAWLVALLVPLLFVLGYELITHHLYGQRLLTEAAGYATKQRGERGNFLNKALVGLSFLGGSCLPVLFLAPWLWSRRVLLGGALGAAALAAFFAWSGLLKKGVVENGAFGVWLCVQAALYAVLGVAVLALAVLELRRKRDAEAALLCAWVVGTYLFTAFVNWTANVRSVLPLLPALGILMVRRLPALSPWVQRGVLALSAALAFAIACSDMSMAESSRLAAHELATANPRAYFEGHWGFQYYAEKEGLRALDRQRDALWPGDYVIIPINNTGGYPFPAGLTKVRGKPSWPVMSGVSTMDAAAGAGFYSAVWGPLPFALGKIAAEDYAILEVQQPMRP